MNPDHIAARTTSPGALPPRRAPSSSTPTSTSTTHQRVVSMSSVSSRGSSTFATSARYPSGMTTLTSLSSDPPSTPVSRSSSTSLAGYHHHRHHHHQQHYDPNSLSEDQFDIINNLDYDDIDDGLIDQELGHRNREDIVQQLYASERAYIESLNLLLSVFLNPLRKDAKQSSFKLLGMKKMVCTEREIRWLFGNLDDIVQAQRDILASLEQRLQIWGPTQIISDVFHSWFPSLNVYHAYLDNYDVAVTTYERLTRYQPFKKFIDAAHKDPSLRGATLLSLLQIPAGCINRYAQLISKLADMTTPMHPDFMGLTFCKQTVLNLADELKPKVDDADNVDQVLMIHQALAGAPFGVKAQRRLVLQGQLSRVVVNSRSTGEERTYFLFSDLLAIVRPKQEGKRTVLQYKGHLNLERARIRALAPEEAGGQEHCIEIVSSFHGVDTLNSTYMGAPTVHVLHANSLQEQEEWLKQLDIVIGKLDKAAAKARHAAAARRMAHGRAGMEPSMKRLEVSSKSASISSGSTSSGATSSIPENSIPSSRR